MTPDPAGLAAVDLSNPQSLNRYAYVMNTPTTLTDPFGLNPAACIWRETWGQNPDGSWELHQELVTCFGDVGGGSTNNIVRSDLGGDPGGGGGPGGGTPGEKRLQCAAQYGTNHSVAAGLGVQNRFVGNLLLGNSASGLANLGVMVFGSKTPTLRDAASMMAKGGAQGIPVPPGHPGMSGAAGQIRSLGVQSAVAAGYNAIAGVGQETIELGITASGTIATPVAQLGTQTLANVAFGVGIAKFAWDTGTFLYGYYGVCHQ